MLLRRTALRSRSRSTGPDQDVVEAVCERARWSCELCGSSVGAQRGVDHHIHHRRPRAAGGTLRPDTNLPSNLLLVCPDCHSTVESRRADGYAGGWLVHQGDDPTRVAVLVRGELWTYLSVDGRYAAQPPVGDQ